MSVLLRSFLLVFVSVIMACDGAAPPRDGLHGANIPETDRHMTGRPNILLIVVDDMGYADPGFNGSEIRTPNLDRLARNGIIFDQFYTAAACSPTRAMLLTGIDHHLVGLGNIMEALTAFPQYRGLPGYEGHLNERIATLPELLNEAGYRTYMAGKWHVGHEPAHGPAARGFDRSFALLDGGGGHFNNMGLQKLPARYRENGAEAELPDDFYSTRFYTDKIIEYTSTESATGQPWFAYLAYTAPHWPLQAPDESIARYAQRYIEGYDNLLAERMTHMQTLGLVESADVISPRLPIQRPWHTLDDETKRIEARKMAIYAAMIDDIDVHIGRVLDHLKVTGQYDNTLVWFLSDNGPESYDEESYPFLAEHIEACCDNSFDNMGGPDSYVMYGPAWARVSAAPFRAFKYFAHEGGIRVPAFVHFPARFSGNRRTGLIATVSDVMPTLLDLAGVKHPASVTRDKIILPMQGKSILPMLTGQTVMTHAPSEIFGWELSNRRAVRHGDWKLVQAEPPYGTGEWELFDLRDDMYEIHDLSAEFPERVIEMKKLWQSYADENGVVLVEMPSNEEMDEILRQLQEKQH